jgi:hypothetical protein
MFSGSVIPTVIVQVPSRVTGGRQSNMAAVIPEVHLLSAEPTFLTWGQYVSSILILTSVTITIVAPAAADKLRWVYFQLRLAINQSSNSTDGMAGPEKHQGRRWNFISSWYGTA